MPVDDYIQIMIESLTKKSELLDRIIRNNEEQHDCVNGKSYDEVNWDSFNLIVDSTGLYEIEYRTMSIASASFPFGILKEATLKEKHQEDDYSN